MTTQPSHTPNADLDVLIVGTGYSGTYLLHHLRKVNYSVKAIDAASELGGVWCHNTYPGSRVDIEVPTYELDIKELYDHPDGGWIWSERFPGREELQAYFHFVDKRLALSKDCIFDTWITSAIWDDEEGKWTVTAKDGRSWKATVFLPCVGYAAKPYIPSFEGLDTFQGQKTHTAQWPKEGIELKGKRVGVIGTGASGVQVIQTIAPIVKHLTVFQQTPATAIPMVQRPLLPATSTFHSSPSAKATFFADRITQWDGAHGSMILRPCKSDPPSTREQEFTRLWKLGGFSFWTSNYMDLFADAESNDLIYQYWRTRILERVKDPSKQNILAPKTAPYAFGTKRVPLEQTYYDIYNQPNVSLIDIRTDPIASIHSHGLSTHSDTFYDLDVLILATGFDFSTGSLTQLNISSRRHRSPTTPTTTTTTTLTEKWADGTKTHLGLSVHGFPNLFFPYGPQSPSNTCNGPLCAQLQGDFIVDLLTTHFPPEQSPQKNVRIEAIEAAEQEWSQHATGLLKGSLFEGTRSYYFADNLEPLPTTTTTTSEATSAARKEREEWRRRKREPLFYFGGVPAYKAKLDECREGGWKGFDIVS